MNRFAPLALFVVSATLLGGCQLNPLAEDNTLTIAPARGGAVSVAFSAAYYSFDARNQVTVVLLDGDPAAPRAAATIRMYWRPQVGVTPVESSATNATVRYIVLEQHGEPTAAVYGGAGFLNPQTARGADTFRGRLVESNLRLVDAPEGFGDVLGMIGLSGAVTAVRDDAETYRLLRLLRHRISDRLGYPRLVMRD